MRLPNEIMLPITKALLFGVLNDYFRIPNPYYFSTEGFRNFLEVFPEMSMPMLKVLVVQKDFCALEKQQLEETLMSLPKSRGFAHRGYESKQKEWYALCKELELLQKLERKFPWSSYG